MLIHYFRISETEVSNWANGFKINWDRFPRELMRACNEGKRPTDNDRRRLIQILEEDIRHYTARPRRKDVDG